MSRCPVRPSGDQPRPRCANGLGNLVEPCKAPPYNDNVISIHRGAPKQGRPEAPFRNDDNDGYNVLPYAQTSDLVTHLA